ncbi:hypothetical protein FBU30_010094 [Linnemannia zychae]|nr:hypothetical protein FBU30_010094 [Linnemannia zychae]
MGYDGISFPVPASAAKRHTEGDSARIHSDWEKDISCTGTQIANRSDLAFLKENDSDQNLAHQTFLQRQSQQLQPTLASSRRNSRILPNPIQPPAISHARKQSVDEIVSKDQDHSLDKSIHPFSTNTSTASFSDLSIPEDDSLTISSSISSFSNTSSHSNSIQHGGFVPGYDPWATKNDKSSIDGANNISTGLNLQNQGPKSELILHDTSSNNLDYLAMKSIHQSSDSLGISSGYHPIRSTSPTNSGPSSGLPTSGTLLSGQTIAARPEPLQHEGNCPLSFVDNQESEQKGVESSASAQHMSLTQSPLHPHYESTISSESRSNPQSSEGPIMEICGLCGVQLATVHFGSCGHRICNVCHRHEKHRSFRLFQNASPPCPFCTHGVTPDQQLPSGKSILSYTDGTMKIRQYAFHHIPQQSYSGQTVSQQGPRQRFQRQRQTNPSSSSFDGVISDDMNEGFLLNRHYHQTFPIYGAATTAPPLRAPSLQLDSMPPAFSGNNSGSFSRSTDHFVQASINQKPPSGFYPFQSSAHPGQNSLRQHHPHKQGLNHHAPNFQPSGVLLAQQCQDNSNLAAMGRPGMITPPTGVWRDSGSGIVDYSSQEYVYQLQSSLPTQYLQQRRGSQQNTLLPSAIVNPSQGFSIYGHTMSNNTGPGATANSSSTTPYFPILPDLPPATPPTRLRTEAIQWAVIRITNIPWDVSLQDMLGFFAGIPVPPEHLLAQNVHILMDRASGKTFNSAFVELALTTRQAEIIAQARNQKVLKGRQVSVELSSQDELLRSVFPKWIGDFLNGEPSISGDRNTGSEAIGGNYDGQHITQWQLDSTKYVQPTPPFITRDEINALLVICRNYKLHFSRKCAERPFENILTILAKYPWHQPHRVLPMHRDHIFELLKLSIESLRMHLSKEYNTIHPTLLSRMVRCAILTPAFTERQKNMVLVVAGMACPEDLVGWMAPPAPVEVVSIPPDSSINSKDSDKGSIILSNSNDTSDKIERSSEMQLIDEAIDCLAISEPSTDSSICSIGDTRNI